MKQRDWLIVLFAIVVIQSILILRPFLVKEQRAEQIPQYYKMQTEEDKSWPQKVVDDPIALFTLVLTLATFGLYLSTRALWNSTEKLVLGAEKTSEMQLRAYVFPNDTVLTVMDGAFFAFCNFKNCGQTPAYDAVMNGGAFIGSYPLKGDEVFPVNPSGDIQSSGFIGPGIIIHSMVPVNGAITEEVYRLLIEERAAIYFFGQVRYLDAFDRRRFVRYCYFKTGNPAAGAMSVYRDFNEAN